MAKLTPRKQLEKYLEIRKREDNIKLFCLIVIHKVPHWLKLFIDQHEREGDLIAYPEFGMTMWQQTAYMTNFLKDNQKVKFIVTQSPWIISDFDRLSAFVIEDSKIEPPRDETFGASVNKITMTILGRAHTCGNRALAVLKDLEKKIKKTNDVKGLNNILDEEIHHLLGESVEKTLLTHSIFSKIDDLEGKNE